MQAKPNGKKPSAKKSSNYDGDDEEEKAEPQDIEASKRKSGKSVPAAKNQGAKNQTASGGSMAERGTTANKKAKPAAQQAKKNVVAKSKPQDAEDQLQLASDDESV